MLGDETGPRPYLSESDHVVTADIVLLASMGRKVGVEVKEMELPTKLMNNDERLWGAEMGDDRIGKVHSADYYMEERGDNVRREAVSYLRRY